ncbi:MAG TPA: hypothetical protein VES73_01835 [Lamprocystis sp. (in: g-proteobacteria)]|nr:hypothetical protein [Lamprocystis sp. (in: g-proteobacteria)]
MAAAERLAGVEWYRHFNLVRIDDAGSYIALLNLIENDLAYGSAMA